MYILFISNTDFESCLIPEQNTTFYQFLNVQAVNYVNFSGVQAVKKGDI